MLLLTLMLQIFLDHLGSGRRLVSDQLSAGRIIALGLCVKRSSNSDNDDDEEEH